MYLPKLTFWRSSLSAFPFPVLAGLYGLGGNIPSEFQGRLPTVIVGVLGGQGLQLAPYLVCKVGHRSYVGQPLPQLSSP